MPQPVYGPIRLRVKEAADDAQELVTIGTNSQRQHRDYDAGLSRTAFQNTGHDALLHSEKVRFKRPERLCHISSQHFLTRTLLKEATEMALNVLDCMKRVMAIMGVRGLPKAMEA